MKKIKKVLAAFLSCAVSLSAVPGIMASAVYMPVTAPEDMIIPNGYEKYEENYSEITYQNSKNHYVFTTYDSFKYNHLHLAISNTEIWDKIYEKYAEELNYDEVNKYEIQPGAVYVTLYDVPQESDDPKAPASAQNKQELAKKFCAELMDSGCILSAEYTEFRAERKNWWVEKWIEINNFTGTAEEVQSIADKYSEKASVSVSEGKCSVNAVSDENLLYDDFMSMYNEIDALYADDKASVINMYQADASVISSQEVDILSELNAAPAILYGDLSLDGRVGIADAVIMNKHINGSVTLNADQQKAADLDANGEVNTDDLFVLMQYLVSIIDTFPAAE